MKKVLVLLVMVCMVGLFATSASAAAVFYVDTLVGGQVEKENALLGGKEDLDLNVISGGTMIDNFKIGAEYGFGDVEGDDVSLWSVKGGYRFVNTRATKLDGIVAYLNIHTDDSDLNSVLVGLDFTQYFSEKFFLTAAYVVSTSGEYEHALLGTDKTAPTDMYRIKFHYLITDNLGLTAGYTKLSYKFDPVTMPVGRVDVGMGGASLGLVYVLR